MERTADFDKLARKDIVEVEWWDAHGSNGWVTMETALDGNHRAGVIRSIGYVLAEDDTWLTITESITGGGQAGDVRDIAKVCIVSRSEVDMPGRLKNVPSHPEASLGEMRSQFQNLLDTPIARTVGPVGLAARDEYAEARNSRAAFVQDVTKVHVEHLARGNES